MFQLQVHRVNLWVSRKLLVKHLPWLCPFSIFCVNAQAVFLNESLEFRYGLRLL